jgi:hypothetical protein
MQLGQKRARPLLARNRPLEGGRECPLSPGTSDVNLFRYCERVVDLYAKVSHRALNLGVAK